MQSHFVVAEVVAVLADELADGLVDVLADDFAAVQNNLFLQVNLLNLQKHFLQCVQVLVLLLPKPYKLNAEKPVLYFAVLCTLCLFPAVHSVRNLSMLPKSGKNFVIFLTNARACAIMLPYYASVQPAYAVQRLKGSSSAMNGLLSIRALRLTVLVSCQRPVLSCASAY